MAASTRVEPRLHRQMHVIAEDGIRVHGVDDVALHEIARMRSGVADAADAGDLADRGEQRGESPSRRARDRDSC